MSQPVVDVVIPSYNRAYCLAHAVDSVLDQTYPHCRAILVDDGSTDATPALMADRYGGNERVVYLRQTNAGVTAARNAGLARADRDFVAFLDSDDCWRLWKVELQLDCLRSLPGVGMIWTDMDAVDDHYVVIKPRYLRTMYGNYKRVSTEEMFGNVRPLETATAVEAGKGANLYWGEIFTQMVRGNLVHTSTTLLTRERAARVGGFNEALKHSGEDYDFHLRTCREGPVAFADVASILYRIGSADQLTQPAYHVHIARNYLNTIEPVIAADRARIALPDEAIVELLAGAHAWLAHEMFLSRDNRGAFRHARRSLGYELWQRRTWAVLAAAAFPSPATGALIDAWRATRRTLAPLKRYFRKPG